MLKLKASVQTLRRIPPPYPPPQTTPECHPHHTNPSTRDLPALLSVVALGSSAKCTWTAHTRSELLAGRPTLTAPITTTFTGALYYPMQQPVRTCHPAIPLCRRTADVLLTYIRIYVQLSAWVSARAAFLPVSNRSAERGRRQSDVRGSEGGKWLGMST